MRDYATSFLARDADIDALSSLVLGDARLITVFGPGGMGKTRLALEIGWRLVEPEAFGLQGSPFSDGVYFVPLQPVELAREAVQPFAHGRLALVGCIG